MMKRVYIHNHRKKIYAFYCKQTKTMYYNLDFDGVTQLIFIIF